MTIPHEIVDRLRCPTCGEPVAWRSEELGCPHGHVLPFHDGYLSAAEAEHYSDSDTVRTASSFGYEWTTFDAIQPEDAEFWRMYFRDVPPDAYTGKVALDAGCGKGRYSRSTAAHVKALVAADNSVAVEAAARNLAGCENVVVVKADLRSLPFAGDSFEFISCLGVLHHLADPESGFRSLVRLLGPGGHILLYVYSTDGHVTLRTAGLAAAAQLRRITVRIPHRLLRLLSAPLAGVLYGTVVVPGRLGSRLKIERLAALPLATYRGMPVRSLWLDTFDRLSAPVEHRYRQDEIEAWFHRAGLEILATREEAGLFLVGRRPLAD
jgi:SAM-dependent methyltransferase